MNRRRVDVTFSPPTPNGDFHLGHLAGPVLSADVYARAQRLAGHDVRFASSTDDNQTYVVTTARRLGCEPHALIDDAFAQMRSTLAHARVELDLFERPDARYVDFVRTFFGRLWSAGSFDRRTVHLPYDDVTGQYRAEAFVTGRCPTCLSHARAGVCEACGLYNLPEALLETDEHALPRLPVDIWVLDLERYRDRIERWYDQLATSLRPDLRDVVDATLMARLPYVPITYPGDWGISVGWDGPDDRPQTINAWPEIFVGHVHWLSRARGSDRFDPDELTQFIGIDNGFYNAFCYVTLDLLAADAGIPIELPGPRTLTNQYFLLAGRKFSTSKGDVVWAADYLRRTGADRARIVLALKSPELQQSEFTDEVMDRTLADRVDQPLVSIRDHHHGLIGEYAAGDPSPWWAAALSASTARFERAYAPDDFSIRAAAEALVRHLEFLAATPPPVGPRDDADLAGRLRFLAALRVLAWPIAPGLAETVGAAFGIVPTGEAPRLAEVRAAPPDKFQGIDLTGLAVPD